MRWDDVNFQYRRLRCKSLSKHSYEVLGYLCPAANFTVRMGVGEIQINDISEGLLFQVLIFN